MSVEEELLFFSRWFRPWRWNIEEDEDLPPEDDVRWAWIDLGGSG